MEAFSKLTPVTYNYKTNKDEAIVGFIAEDVPDVLAPNDHKSLSGLEMVALLTKVVQETRAEAKTDIEAKNVEIEAIKIEITELKTMQKKVAQMEAILTNLALNTSNTKKEKISINLK